MQNIEFFRANGMFQRVQSLFMKKWLFIKILCTSWRLTGMAPDTPTKRRGMLQFLISYLFKYLYHYFITLCEETTVWRKFSPGKVKSLFPDYVF